MFKNYFSGINFDWKIPRKHDEWIAYRNLMIRTKLFVARYGRSANVAGA